MDHHSLQQNVNIYGAFDAYQNSARLRKYLIAEREDGITNLKNTLEKENAVTTQLEQKCEKFTLHGRMDDANTAAEEERKLKQERRALNIEEESEETFLDLAKVKTNYSKMLLREESRIVSLQNTERQYMERYMVIPEVAALVNATKELNSLCNQTESSQEDVLRNLVRLEEFLQQIKNEFPHELQALSGHCVELAKNKKTLDQFRHDKEKFEAHQSELQIRKDSEEVRRRSRMDRTIGMNVNVNSPMRYYPYNRQYLPLDRLRDSLSATRYPPNLPQWKHYTNTFKQRPVQIDTPSQPSQTAKRPLTRALIDPYPQLQSSVVPPTQSIIQSEPSVITQTRTNPTFRVPLPPSSHKNLTQPSEPEPQPIAHLQPSGQQLHAPLEPSGPRSLALLQPSAGPQSPALQFSEQKQSRSLLQPLEPPSFAPIQPSAGPQSPARQFSEQQQSPSLLQPLEPPSFAPIQPSEPQSFAPLQPSAPQSCAPLQPSELPSFAPRPSGQQSCPPLQASGPPAPIQLSGTQSCPPLQHSGQQQSNAPPQPSGTQSHAPIQHSGPSSLVPIQPSGTQAHAPIQPSEPQSFAPLQPTSEFMTTGNTTHLPQSDGVPPSVDLPFAMFGTPIPASQDSVGGFMDFFGGLGNNEGSTSTPFSLFDMNSSGEASNNSSGFFF